MKGSWSHFVMYAGIKQQNSTIMVVEVAKVAGLFSEGPLRNLMCEYYKLEKEYGYDFDKLDKLKCCSSV